MYPGIIIWIPNNHNDSSSFLIPVLVDAEDYDEHACPEFSRYVTLEIKIMHRIIHDHPEILALLKNYDMPKSTAVGIITKIVKLSLEYSKNNQAEN